MEIKQGGVVSRLLADVPIPRMFRAEQLFPRERIAPADIPAKGNAQKAISHLKEDLGKSGKAVRFQGYP